MVAVAHRRRAGDVLRQQREELRVQVHQIAVIAVRLVKLQHREFRIVLRGDALVSEIPVDLINAIDSAHRQSLQIQFGGDAQVQVDVQSVVVGDERPGRRPARNGMHHRRFYFDITSRIEESPQFLNDPRAGHKYLA